MEQLSNTIDHAGSVIDDLEMEEILCQIKVLSQSAIKDSNL